MEYLIATFRSRNITVRVYNYLVSEYGITCSLVSTPRGANVGCGLSIKFGAKDYQLLRQNLPQVESFSGIFRVRVVNGKTIVTRA